MVLSLVVFDMLALLFGITPSSSQIYPLLHCLQIQFKIRLFSEASISGQFPLTILSMHALLIRHNHVDFCVLKLYYIMLCYVLYIMTQNVSHIRHVTSWTSREKPQISISEAGRFCFVPVILHSSTIDIKIALTVCFAYWRTKQSPTIAVTCCRTDDRSRWSDNSKRLSGAACRHAPSLARTHAPRTHLRSHDAGETDSTIISCCNVWYKQTRPAVCLSPGLETVRRRAKVEEIITRSAASERLSEELSERERERERGTESYVPVCDCSQLRYHSEFGDARRPLICHRRPVPTATSVKMPGIGGTLALMSKFDTRLPILCLAGEVSLAVWSICGLSFIVRDSTFPAWGPWSLMFCRKQYASTVYTTQL